MADANPLTELAERVSALTEACRETDLAILQMITGHAWRWVEGRMIEPKTVITWDKYGADASGNPVCSLEHFSGSFRDASTLKPEACTFALGDCNEDNGPWACVTDAEGVDYTATGATPILAFVAAILRARAASENSHG